MDLFFNINIKLYIMMILIPDKAGGVFHDDIDTHLGQRICADDIDTQQVQRCYEDYIDSRKDWSVNMIIYSARSEDDCWYNYVHLLVWVRLALCLTIVHSYVDILSYM